MTPITFKRIFPRAIKNGNTRDTFVCLKNISVLCKNAVFYNSQRETLTLKEFYRKQQSAIDKKVTSTFESYFLSFNVAKNLIVVNYLLKEILSLTAF
jgi:hypothetical protein